MQDKTCARCGGSKFVAMEVVTSGQGGGGFVLRPRHCQGWDYSMAMASPLSACIACGHVWSSVSPQALRAFILAHGNPLVRQHLDNLDHGPHRDLPDTELAREIGAAVAEIDALSLVGTAAARRYRELRGVTWDQALQDMRAWPRLSRIEKLELFGWAPKKKAEATDLDFDAPFP